MAKKPTASDAAVIPAPPAPIVLDLRRHTTITLMPLDIRLRAVSLTSEATAISAIESTGALETADAVAANLKTLEAEIETNMKAQLEPLEQALAAVKASAAEVLLPLLKAREELTIRVVSARTSLGYEGSTSCYSQERSEVVVDNIAKVPATLSWRDKNGGVHVETLLKVDPAAVARLHKAGVHVPGVHEGTKITYGTKGAR